MSLEGGRREGSGKEEGGGEGGREGRGEMTVIHYSDGTTLFI